MEEGEVVVGVIGGVGWYLEDVEFGDGVGFYDTYVYVSIIR